MTQASYLFEWSRVFAIQNEILKESISEISLVDVLCKLTDMLDELNDEQAVGILLMGEEGLRPVAGSQIPKEWRKIISPLPPGACAGSCGTAAFFS